MPTSKSTRGRPARSGREKPKQSQQIIKDPHGKHWAGYRARQNAVRERRMAMAEAITMGAQREAAMKLAGGDAGAKPDADGDGEE